MIKADTLAFKKKTALNIYVLKKNIESWIHELRYIFWECTLRCNLACLHCGSDCKTDNTIPDMPLADFLLVLDSIKPHVKPQKTIVAITGGEPLMRSDIAEAGKEISRRGFLWGMVTNGYSLKKNLLSELISSGLKSLTISLDGLQADHDWFRGKAHSFEYALNAIFMAVEASLKKGLFFDVITCVNQRNIKHLDLLKTKLIRAGVNNWRLATIFPKGRAANNQDLKLTNTQHRELMNFIVATRKEGKINTFFGCEGFLGKYEMEVRDHPFHCKAGISIGSVLIDGSISACPSLRNDYIQGNIYHDDFMEVWEKRFQVMRNRKWAKTGECEGCKVWNYCIGNGLHLREEKTGKLLFCNYKALNC